MKNFIIVIGLVIQIQVLFATTYYLDPINGDINNEGSIHSPWPGLAEIINANLIETREFSPLPYDEATSKLIAKNIGSPIQSGDTLMLMNGMHGAVEIDRHYNEERITLINYPNHTPSLAELHFRASSNWNVVGLTISSEPYGYYTDNHLLFVESHGFRGPASDFTIESCNISAGIDGYNWTIEEWLDRTTNGIYIRGDRAVISNNTLTNINHGIHLVGRNLVATHNEIINFSGDGLRPLGGDILVEHNLIKNCFKINENHDDGIQSFNLNDEDYSNVIIRGNTILNFDNPEQPLLGPLQGIGCFDGPYTDWLIENNVISVDHWHGITLLGAYDCIVRHNTVTDPSPDTTPGPSWIRIGDHKDGTPSARCIVANNLTNNIVSDAVLSSNIEVSTFTEYSEYFQDYTSNNFILLSDCNAIDNADGQYANHLDLLGNPRPSGEGYDIGAYEALSTTITPTLIEIKYQIFPNPFDEVIYIDAFDLNVDLKDISIYNLAGKRYPIDVIQHADRISIHPSNLELGIYLLSINDTISKVIKL